MRKSSALLLLLFALGLPIPAHSSPVTIDLGSLGGGPYEFSANFADLNGTPISGQAQSLNIMFATPGHAPYSIYDVVLIWRTDFGAFPGFLEPGTGFLMADGGAPLTPELALGRASGDDGSMAAGIIGGGPLTGLFDVRGAHFDTAFPNLPGHFVTGATLVVDALSVSVPEPASLVLLAGGIAALLAGKRRRRFHRT